MIGLYGCLCSIVSVLGFLLVHEGIITSPAGGGLLGVGLGAFCLVVGAWVEDTFYY